MSSATAGIGNREDGVPPDRGREKVDDSGGDSGRSREMCLGNNEIKNRAVKYSAAPQPTTYALLQEKTDLKLPPANWLLESPQRGPTGTSVLGSSSKSKPFSRTSRRSPTVSPMSVWQSTVWEGLSF